MSGKRLRRVVLAALLAAWLATNLAAPSAPAAAQVMPANAVVGLIRVINAINRRNRVYQAGRDTQHDFDAYYASLRSTAREQLITGELHSLRQGEGGLLTVRAAAYIRLNASLAAEQAAITRAIDAETNQARRDFNRTLVRQLQQVVLQLPGAQQILGEVRTVIANVRNTVIALQTAAAANQPLDVLTQRLAEQVSSSTVVQDRVRNLGSMLGPDLDRALGGALTQVNNTITDVNREASQAVTLLDGMDAQVAALDLTQAQPAQRELPLGPVPIRLTERATAVLDVASQALAYLSLMQSPGGTTREQMYNQIRQDLLNERNASLLDAVQHVSQIECSGVGRGEYETAAGMLGKAPETAADPAKASYMVCKERDSGQPVRAWIVPVGLPTATPGGTPTATSETEIPVGSYVGTTTMPEAEGMIGLENRIRVVVAEDGGTSGEMYVLMEETVEYVPGCPSHQSKELRAPIEGRLTSGTGQVQIPLHQDYTSTPLQSGDCVLTDRSPLAESSDWPVVAEVSIVGPAMHGEVWLQGRTIFWFAFDATRE